MAKIILTAWEAERVGGFVQTHLDLGGTGPFADMRRTSEVKNVAEAQEELRLFAQQVESRALALGKGASCSVTLARGERAPNGFRKAQLDCYVNLDQRKDEIAAGMARMSL